MDPSVNSAIAARNVDLDPKRSAMRPLAGMNIAKVSRYAVNAIFICNGSVSKLRAMVGSAVARTVPSSCSMNIALATIIRTVRGRACRSRRIASGGGRDIGTD
jgi:hypothetical protein